MYYARKVAGGVDKFAGNIVDLRDVLICGFEKRWSWLWIA